MMLFEPLSLPCGITLRNRTAVAALTNLQSDLDGLLGDDELEFLAARADGGFAMVTTCATYVAPDGKGWAGELGIDRDACVDRLVHLAGRLRASGACGIVQLFHGGASADPEVTGERPWSATAWTVEPAADRPAVDRSPRAATADDITRAIDAFVEAAARAERAGFDGVELHAAHGYLLSQFLSRTINTRTDEWGGTRANRERMIREIARRVRARCGARFAVGVRISLEDFGRARGLDLDDSLATIRGLVDDGIDFVHVSLWDARRMTAKRPDEHPLALVRAIVPRDIAIVTAGDIWTRADAEAALACGADVVALGRAAICNPDWPRRVERGHDFAARGEVPPAENDIARPPLTRAELGDRAVSRRFQDYLTRWKTFVAD